MPGIEHSPNARASCQTCRGKIWKGCVRVSTATREGASKYHHADCYSRGDKSAFYGFAQLDADVRAAILCGRPTEHKNPPPPCDDRFCAHGPGCKGRPAAAAAPPSAGAVIDAPQSSAPQPGGLLRGRGLELEQAERPRAYRR